MSSFKITYELPDDAALPSDKVRKELAKNLGDAMDRQMMELMTSTVEQEPTSLDVKKMLEDFRKIELNARRDSITFQVDLAHEGPPLRHSTPTDGDIVEMSWHQLLELHKHWPVKLHEVHDEHRADFVPALRRFDTFIPLIPPAPPWEVPERMEDDS